MSSENYELYEFGEFRLNVRERKLERLDGPWNGSLPEKAFQTLVHLVRNSGTLVTKEELLLAVWPDTVVEENNLGKAVHAIRQCLGEKSGEHRYVETVPKHGYRFVAEVRRVENGSAQQVNGEAAADGAADEPKEPVASSPVIEDRPAVRSFIPVLVVLLLAAIGFGAWAVLSGRRSATVAASRPETEGPAKRSEPERSPAYDLYVRGKVKVASEKQEDSLAAAELLEQAVAVDPYLAEAHAQLARAYNTIAFKYSAGVEAKRFQENAEVAIEKALALNPDLAEAHFARGLIVWSNIKGFPHEQAIQSYRRSIALDPNNDEAHHQLSMVYSHIGLLEEARESVKRAIEINPNNTLARYRAGVYLAYQGRFQDAIAVYKTIPRDSTPLLVDRTLAEVLIQTGKLREAETIVDEYLGRYPKDEGGSFTSVKALLLAIGGRHREAEEMANRAVEIGKGFGHFHHTLYNVASVYAAMGRAEEAMQYLELAADQGFPNYSYFETDPNLNNIRTHPRFIEFMTGLKSRWEKYKALA